MGYTRKERRRKRGSRIVGMEEGRKGRHEWDVVMEIWRRDERKGIGGEGRRRKRREEREEYECETRMEENRRGRENTKEEDDYK